MSIDQDPYGDNLVSADPAQSWAYGGQLGPNDDAYVDDALLFQTQPTVSTLRGLATNSRLTERGGGAPRRNVGWRTAFGNHLRADYRDFVPPRGLLLGDMIDEHPNFDEERGAGEVLQTWRAYNDTFNSPTKATVRAGMPLELLVRDCDEKFCREFLTCMASLGFEAAERLIPATAERLEQQLGVNSSEIAKTLEALVTPEVWEQEPMFKYRPSKSTLPRSDGPDALSGSYGKFLRKLADDSLPPTYNNRAIRGYPLERMNNTTWLYLCEDGLLRVKIGSNLVVAPPPSRSLTRRGYNLAIPNATIPKEYLEEATVRIGKPKRIALGEPLPTQPDELASSPRQRLIEISAHVLASRSRTTPAA